MSTPLARARVASVSTAMLAPRCGHHLVDDRPEAGVDLLADVRLRRLKAGLKALQFLVGGLLRLLPALDALLQRRRRVLRCAAGSALIAASIA
jgi:hypothetical protein